MNKIDFMAYVAKNIHDMKELQLKYKYKYDKSDRQEMYKIARKICRYNKIEVEEVKEKINENEIINTFLSSLEILDNNKIMNFYKNNIDKIKIVRQRCVDDEEAVLEYDVSNKNRPIFRINFPKTSLTMTNQLGFAHEMGHIPEIAFPRRSYLEYSEVFPMFLEYLTALTCFNNEDGKYAFLDERLSMLIDEAISITRLYSKCEIREESQRVYFSQKFAEMYSLIESFDYTLQLIDIFEKDKTAVTGELEKFIKGKSLINIADDLSIESTGCKRLLKEYKDED